jgi:peptide-methionine (R)-S-oxide reductase
MDRRTFIERAAGGASALVLMRFALPGQAIAAERIEKLIRSNAEWKKRLTPAQYHILREEGTERAFSSPLDQEKRRGQFVCVACDLPLFPSRFKYDSGTGWPSFYDVLPGHVETRTDFKLVLPRTEYHCARCGGHHGHVFNDGPKPTGLRYCNNGLALKFIPDKA